jgi:hypothetical protein
MDDSALDGTDSGNLTTKQRRLLGALLTERSVDSAAKKADIGRSTAYAMLRDPAFAEALKAAELQSLQEAVRGLIGLAQTAITVMATTLEDTKASPATRLRAADSVVSHLMKLREAVSVEERLAALETRLGLAEGGNR